MSGRFNVTAREDEQRRLQHVLGTDVLTRAEWVVVRKQFLDELGHVVAHVRGHRHPQREELVHVCPGGFLAAVRCDSGRSEEHTSELQSLMRFSYAVFVWKK